MIQGYPTLKYFSAGVPEDYQGGRTKEDLLDFANRKFETHKPPKELKQMVSQKEFNEYCRESDGFCLIAFLPHL